MGGESEERGPTASLDLFLGFLADIHDRIGRISRSGHMDQDKEKEKS